MTHLSCAPRAENVQEFYCFSQPSQSLTCCMLTEIFSVFY